jgi:hypothetical protein
MTNLQYEYSTVQYYKTISTRNETRAQETRGNNTTVYTETKDPLDHGGPHLYTLPYFVDVAQIKARRDADTMR